MSVEKLFAELCLSEASDAVPVKSLVFKPKTPKTATPVPIVVVALQSTTTPSPVIAQETSSKEPRLARDDLFKEFFQCPTAGSYNLSYLANASSEFKLLVDKELEALADSTALQLNETLFITKGQLTKYLAKFESSKKTVDFSQVVQKAEPKQKQQQQGSSSTAAPSSNSAVIEECQTDRYYSR